MPVEQPRYPVELLVFDRPCLVVGGGTVATVKVAGLVEAGAIVHVVAPEVAAQIRAMPGVTWDQRPYLRGEVDGYWLVITASSDPEVNRAVHDDAVAQHIWVNSADDPANCSFILPARMRQGDLTVSVSTGGRSPAFATWMKRRLEAEIGPEFAALLDIVSEVRRSIRESGESTEALDWQSALDSGMLELVREGRLAEAKERLQTCLSSSSA